MSKELEALNRLKTFCLSETGMPYKMYSSSAPVIEEDASIVEQALKRNEPKKIIVIPPTTIPSNFRSDYLCPNCNHECLVKYQNYCDICGQRLDWESK